MFSIIIPMYNSERFLNQCFRSIELQQYEDYEVICVDDCSNDSTEMTVRKKCTENNRFQYIKKKRHTNAGDARNIGLKYASKDYILFLDSDDYLNENILTSLYKEVQRTGSDIIVFQYKLYYQNLNRESNPVYGIHVNKKKSFYLEQLKRKKFEFTNIAVWNKLYKRSFIEKNDLRFKSYSALNDVYFSWCAFIAAQSITLFRQIGVYYRVNQRTATSDKLADNTRIFIDAFEDVYYHLVENKIWDIYSLDFISAANNQITEFEKRLKANPTLKTNYEFFEKRKQVFFELMKRGNVTNE